MKTAAALALLLVANFAYSQGNLLRNPGFETVPDGSTGAGLMPSDWTAVNQSPDTYSNDGSFGIPPSTFDNFTGITAFEGNQWVAGWSTFGEQFGQTLSIPLLPSADYQLSGYLQQAVRADLNNPGGYDVYLSPNAGTGPSGSTFLGTLGLTAGVARGWESFAINFNTPANADQLPFLLFNPIADSSGSAYPGLDGLFLAQVPEPSTWNLLFLAGLLMGARLRVRGRIQEV